MRKNPAHPSQNCQMLRHLSAFAAIVLVMILCLSPDLFAKDLNKGRAPANFTPSDDLGFVPLVQEIEVKAEETLKDDRAGTLKSMRSRFDSWQATEDYANAWNLESTGMYHLSTQSERRTLAQSGFLKYFDQRLSGEVKSAKRGTPMASMRTLEQTLKPDTSVAVADNVKVRFTGRLIQQYAKIIVTNPYVKIEGMMYLDGNMELKLSKEFEQLAVKTELNMDLDQGRYLASVDKRITERWSTRISSDQENGEAPFAPDLTTYQVFYGFSF